MASASSVDPSQRLPWLSDPAPRPAPPRSRVALVLMAAAAGAVGAAGWTALERAVVPEPTPVGPAETVRLAPPAPPARSEAAERPASERDARSLPAAPPVRAAEPAPSPKARAAPVVRKTPTAKRRPVRKCAAARPRTTPAPRAPAAAPAAAYDARAWNSGVAGRIIQLGAFRTPAQANGQWNRVYYRYPLLRPLPPRVVRSRIRGKTYYRLQLGTFSHAHSELLCQRLRAIGEGCIVLGLNRRGRQA